MSLAYILNIHAIFCSQLPLHTKLVEKYQLQAPMAKMFYQESITTGQIA